VSHWKARTTAQLPPTKLPERRSGRDVPDERERLFVAIASPAANPGQTSVGGTSTELYWYWSSGPVHWRLAETFPVREVRRGYRVRELLQPFERETCG
jgi:hypothetical protein